MKEIQRDDNKANKYVVDQIAPVIKARLGLTGEFQKILWGDERDTEHGVDYECDGVSFSMRVQDGYDMDTFTVRILRPSGKPTEANKLLQGEIQTDYTVQAYVIKQKLHRMGMIRTEELIKHICQKQFDGLRYASKNTSTWQLFGYISFASLPDTTHIFLKGDWNDNIQSVL